MPPSKLQLWFMAFRPKTLTASIAPVLIGTAMAYGDGIEHFPTALVCLFCALTIQIGTNLANDYFDFKKGTDTDERLGPTRVTQAGLIPPPHMVIAFSLTFTLTALASLYLVYRGGLPIALIAILSILSGIFYTAGPRPLGYVGLGDIFVLIFFGPVAVAGTYYVQSFELNSAVILAGFAPGLISTAILCVNNMRDIESDKKSGKNTLAVRFGTSFAQTEYMICIFSAAIVPVLIFIFIEDHLNILYSVLIIFLAIPAFKTILSKTDGTSLNNLLAYTGKILLIFSIIFSIGWIT